jgi:hypothetical protein
MPTKANDRKRSQQAGDTNVSRTKTAQPMDEMFKQHGDKLERDLRPRGKKARREK